MKDVKEKRIYSKNLMAYIMMHTDLIPVIEKDDKGFCYALFVYCEAVNQAIKQYRDRKTVVNLRDYTDSFHRINEMVNQARGIR